MLLPQPHASPRQVVRELTACVTPHDDREAQDRSTILDWIDGGSPLFRITPPVTPDPHLCVYAVLFDQQRRGVLLADHVKARRWLPFPGGHVEDGEDPRATALRETAEELQIAGQFHPVSGDRPFFVSVTKTVGPDIHTDKTLWFLLAADQDMELSPDPREAKAVRWFNLDDPADWANQRVLDPHMLRFNDKLRARLSRD